MKNPLLWKLLATISGGTVLLFWAISWLTVQTQTSMSYLASEHQQRLLNYGLQAEQIYLNQGEAALSRWLQDLQNKEDTWAAVVTSNITPFADSVILPELQENFQLGRSVEWKIHLYFNYNPVMEVPFLDNRHHLLIRLPRHMRPGNWLPHTEILLQIFLPLLLLCALSYVLYQHVMAPLRKLQAATHEFSQGNLEVRVHDAVKHRHDEIARLALTFDVMAQRTSQMIYNQRQMLSDLSHELRTPLTRIDIAIDCLERPSALPQSEPPVSQSESQPGRQSETSRTQQALQRLRYESQTMRELAEDTLTLAWLNTESPQLNDDHFDLAELVEVIAEDARFEFPHHDLQLHLPQQAVLNSSNQQALGQAIENILRNALRHTPEAGVVTVKLDATQQYYVLLISDQGPGVPDALLQDIFKPFFRVDASRTSHQPLSESGPESQSAQPAAVQTGKRGGFGLGLALALRQIQAVGGTVNASNQINQQDQKIGLQIRINLPRH